MDSDAREVDYGAFIGLDWGSEKHAIAFQAAGSNEMETYTIKQTPEDLHGWILKLRDKFGGRPIAVAIEQTKGAVIHALLETADKTTLALLRMKKNAHQPYDYHTGEIAGFGTLICDECGEKLHFHKAGHIPPCPKCHKTSFHRIQID